MTVAGNAAPTEIPWSTVQALRRTARDTLIERRLALPVRERQVLGARIRARLSNDLDLRRYARLGFYWPIRGEFDLRETAAQHIANGGIACVPVVVHKNAPVEFWQWQPDTPMQPGFWNIPVPVERRLVAPDALLIPLVGFDAAGYRLGYGGGYYDRTLAPEAARPFRIGVGYADAEFTTIHPQPHDVPMNVIVTEKRLRYFARPKRNDS